MANFLAPIINDQQEDSSGNPLSGGTIEVYLAGTSTPATTYSTQSGTANTWPITLNTLGVNSQGAVWLTGGVAYKFIIKNSTGVVQRTIDNVSGINDTSITPDQWVVYQATPTYVSATSFTVAGDQTQTFQPRRRIRTINTGGTVYSSIVSSTYSAPNTTVVVANDSGSLDSGLSQVSYGILSITSTSLPGRVLNITSYTTAGAFSFVVPANVFSVRYRLVGGGGGAGGSATTTMTGGGGGGGGYCEGILAVTPGQSVSGSVGALGGGGTGGNVGNAGGNTTFSTATANGGAGGGAGGGGTGAGGTGGSASGGSINSVGSDGGDGSATGAVGGGQGGGSVMGGATRSGTTGRNSLSIGGGGAACYALTLTSGGNGHDGAAFIEWLSV